MALTGALPDVRSRMPQKRILTGIFLFSFSALSYEIVLTRIFSISLWYHFAFMVISISMLGIGASGTVLSLFPRLKASSPHSSALGGGFVRPGESAEADRAKGYESVRSKIGLYGLLLGVSITVSYVTSNRIPFDPVRLSWDRMQLLYICLYYLLLSMPFFFFGLSVSTAFSAMSEKAGLLYGSDLLGAGTGSLFLLYLMSIMAPEYVVVLESTIALAGAFIIGERKLKVLAVFLVLVNAAVFTAPELISPRMSPYKGLQLALRYPEARHIGTYNSAFSRIDIFESPAARSAPGLSLRYLDALPEQTGLSIDGGDMNAVTHADGSESFRFLAYLPSALPYEIRRRDEALILDPKGGLEALLARHYGSKNISKVESNPLVIRVVRDSLRDISGGIYDEDTWSGLGRSWLRTRDETFDIIDIPLTGTSPSGSFGISEDYRLTVEAFKEYLGRLKRDGILSVHLFILPPPRLELRIMGTIAKAMEEMGLSEIDKKIIAIRSWGTVCILAGVSPFGREDIEAVKEFSRDRRFDLIYLPGIKKEETNVYVRMPSNEYFDAFKAILDPETRQSFEAYYLFDIKPVRDENPFFHYFLKLKNIKKIYEIMGEKWQYFIEEGYLLPAVFLQVLLLSLILVLLPAFSKVKAKAEAKKKNNRPLNLNLLYFAFLGLGFMFVEMSLIQQMILPLENPSYAVAAVLTSILVGSGIGSLLSHRLAAFKKPLMLLVISLLIFAYSLLIPSISNALSPYPLSLKIVSIFVILSPLSLLMGIPFPLGIRNIGQGSPHLIPWAWAVNGSLSVLAPILTIMLAMVVGFKAVLWIGAGSYLLAFFTFPAAET